MTAIFVTAAGTEIGKTFVTAGLIRAFRRQGRAVEALKPVISGFDMETLRDSDTGILLEALDRNLTPDEAARISPWRFKAPLSPDMAAAREGAAIDFDALLSFSQARIAARRDVLLIEGVGGVMVPLDHRHTTLDWMAALGLPVLLVAGSYLGAISHGLTALDALTRRGLAVNAVVVSESVGSTVGLAETAAAIQRFAGAIPVTALPRFTDSAAAGPAFEALSGLL